MVGAADPEQGSMSTVAGQLEQNAPSGPDDVGNVLTRLSVDMQSHAGDVEVEYNATVIPLTVTSKTHLVSSAERKNPIPALNVVPARSPLVHESGMGLNHIQFICSGLLVMFSWWVPLNVALHATQALGYPSSTPENVT